MSIKTKLLYLIFISFINICLANTHIDTTLFFVSNNYNIIIIDSVDGNNDSYKWIVMVSHEFETSKIKVPSIDDIRNFTVDTLIKKEQSFQIDVSYGGGNYIFMASFRFYINDYRFVLKNIEHAWLAPNKDAKCLSLFFDSGYYSKEYDIAYLIDVLSDLSAFE